MQLELGLEVSDLGLELLDLGQEGEHDRSDRRGSSLPVRRWNAERWRKLAHGASMKQTRRPVKSDVLP
jgi:hypothetical protein